MILLVTSIFIIGYVLITLEHRWKLNKSITATALAGILWILIAFNEGHGVAEALHPIAAETFELVVFLLSAMTLVEFLVHYRFFDMIRMRLYRLGLDDYRQLWLISGITFLFSAVIDNLTTTIVMIQIARRFFGGKNLILAASLIVVSANAGGAFSPIGDVTTIMLWLAGKFTSMEVILWGFLPALSLWLVSTWMITSQLGKDTADETPQTYEKISLSRSELVVVTASFSSFAFPFLAHLIGLPPYIGLMFGVGLVGCLVSFFANGRSKKETHLSMDIQHLLGRIDITSLLFFIGILFSVGALGHVGILSSISNSVFGADPAVMRLVAGNVLLGVFSAVVDNIPLTAAAIDILNSSDPMIWVLLALSVGTGGSLLAIGSAAGVVAMGMVREITFKSYLRYATLPAFVGYVAAITVWFIQYLIFHSS